MLTDYILLQQFGTSNALCYYRHHQRHRKNGPDIVTRDMYEYHQYGKLHRTDGPAIIIGKHKVYAFYGKTSRTT